ncbi:MAG: hypothetical protein ACTSUS_06910, partial [Candidatus Freyarchaeota archaeon]
LLPPVNDFLPQRSHNPSCRQEYFHHSSYFSFSACVMTKMEEGTHAFNHKDTAGTLVEETSK